MVVAEKVKTNGKPNGQVVELPVQKSIEQQVYEWMDAAAKAGVDTSDAIADVQERIIQAGLSEGFVRSKIGWNGIRLSYAYENRVQRVWSMGHLGGGRVRSDVPERRIDTENLKTQAAIMESLHKIGGAWVRLGNMDAKDCARLATLHRKLSSTHAKTALAFEHLHKTLEEKGGLVEERFTEEQLKALFAPEKEHAA